MTQIFVLAPRVECWVRAGRGPVSDRVENVKNGSARHCWNRSRRDGGKRGKAGVSSGWDERGDEVLTPSVLFSGKAVVWRFTYEQTLPPALSPETASATAKPFLSVTAKIKSCVFCSSHAGVTHGKTRDHKELTVFFKALVTTVFLNTPQSS